MGKDTRPSNSIKLVWRDLRAEGTGLGVVAIILIIILIAWIGIT